MRRVRSVVTALLAVLALVLVGCIGQTPVSPSPSPAPTFRCTPEAGGSEAPCSDQQYQEMKAKDALYAEAEQVYRTYQAEFLKVIRAGGADKLTPGLEAVLGSDDARKSALSQLRTFKKRNVSIKGPGVQIVSVVRRPGLVRADSLVSMDFCVDSRSTRIYRNSKLVAAGSLGVETTYFGRVSNRLKITYIHGEGVDSC